MSAYREHMAVEYAGFLVSDTTTNSGNERIWVGYGGMEGSWLSPDEVAALADVLKSVRDAHLARIAGSKA